MPAEKPDPWRLLEQYRAQWKEACDQIDDALNRLDPVAEREAKAGLERLSKEVHGILEGLQARYSEHQGIRDALTRCDRFQAESRRPRVLLAADARSMLHRLDDLTNSAVAQPAPTGMAAAPAPPRGSGDPLDASTLAEKLDGTGASKKRGRPITIPDERKELALIAKANGKSNKECSQIVYDTVYVTPQQVKNVSSILKHYAKNRSRDAEDRPAKAEG